MPGSLYLIPNTLGQTISEEIFNPLSHIIPAAVQTITVGIDYFIVENAKNARAFLKLIATTQPFSKALQEISIVELNINTEPATLPKLLAPLLAGKDAGLISDAGVPAVADPGANLVRLAHASNIPVKPLVGPSSLLLAVMASGLNGQNFSFNGYLPRDASQRIKCIKALEERSRQERQTQLFIETPYRNIILLEALVTTCQPNTMICIATDLTLPSESIRTQASAKWKHDTTVGKTPNFHKRPTVFLLLAD